MHLSRRIASAGRGTGRDDAVDSARSSAVSTMSAARRFSSRCSRDFAPGIGTMKAPAREPWVIGQAMASWASVAFFARDGLERRAQPKVIREIGAVEARQLRANIVHCHFLRLEYLDAQHPAPEHGIGHHRCKSARNRDPGEMGRTILISPRKSPRRWGSRSAPNGTRHATYSAGDSNAFLYIRGGVPLGAETHARLANSSDMQR